MSKLDGTRNYAQLFSEWLQISPIFKGTNTCCVITWKSTAQTNFMVVAWNHTYSVLDFGYLKNTSRMEVMLHQQGVTNYNQKSYNPGARNFSKISRTNSKIYMSEGWHAANFNTKDPQILGATVTKFSSTGSVHPRCNPFTTVQLLLADRLSNKQILRNPEYLWHVSTRMIHVQFTSCSRFTAGHVICKGSSSSFACVRSLTFMHVTWLLSSEDIGHASVHEQHWSFSKSGHFCKSATTLSIRPLGLLLLTIVGSPVFLASKGISTLHGITYISQCKQRTEELFTLHFYVTWHHIYFTM